MIEIDGRPADVADLAPLALVNFGHFTTMVVDDHHVRGLSLHMERLVRDARLVFGTALDPDRVRELVRRAVGGARRPVVVRVTVFDPALELAHPGVEAHPGILVSTRAAPSAPLPPMRLRSVSYSRELPEVKHVGLFGALRHRRAAQLAGFDDAVFTDTGGHVSEAPTANVGFFDGDRIVWPKADVLAGVTMALLRDSHSDPAISAPVELGDLAGMEAAFVTNAAIGVRPVEAIDDNTWRGDHRLIEQLRTEYLSVRPEPL